MKIVQAPNVVLSQKAKFVNKIDKPILSLVEEMKKTLLQASDPEGVGLAAPQVGKSIQLFITKPTTSSPFSVFINPKVTILDKNLKPLSRPKKTKKPKKLEGCLSLQDIWGEVLRSPKVKVEYMDEKGKNHQKVFSGFMADIIQHETDHLNGILFPKRTLEQKGQLYKSQKDAKNENIFNPIEL